MADEKKTEDATPEKASQCYKDSYYEKEKYQERYAWKHECDAATNKECIEEKNHECREAECRRVKKECREAECRIIKKTNCITDIKECSTTKKNERSQCLDSKFLGKKECVYEKYWQNAPYNGQKYTENVQCKKIKYNDREEYDEKYNYRHNCKSDNSECITDYNYECRKAECRSVIKECHDQQCNSVAKECHNNVECKKQFLECRKSECDIVDRECHFNECKTSSSECGKYQCKQAAEQCNLHECRPNGYKTDCKVGDCGKRNGSIPKTKVENISPENEVLAADYNALKNAFDKLSEYGKKVDNCGHAEASQCASVNCSCQRIDYYDCRDQHVPRECKWITDHDPYNCGCQSQCKSQCSECRECSGQCRECSDYNGPQECHECQWGQCRQCNGNYTECRECSGQCRECSDYNGPQECHECRWGQCRQCDGNYTECRECSGQCRECKSQRNDYPPEECHIKKYDRKRQDKSRQCRYLAPECRECYNYLRQCEQCVQRGIKHRPDGTECTVVPL